MAASAKSPPVSTASSLTLEVSAWLNDPGFTPGAKHFAALFTALSQAEREDARKLERALGRGGEGAGRYACQRLKSADPRERARLIGVLSRVALAAPCAEFRDALGQCRFRDCKHLHEPNCALRAAVAEGKASQERLSLLRKFCNEGEAVPHYERH